VIESFQAERPAVHSRAAATSSRPSVAMISPRAFPLMGGIESHIHEVSSRLVKLGHEVTVISTDPTGRLARQETINGVRFIRVPTWLSQTDYYFAPALYKQIMELDLDVAHIQGYHTFVPPIGMLSAIRKKVPFVITFHSGGHSSGIRKLLRPIQWKSLSPLVRQAARHIGVSEFEANFFSRAMGVARQKFTVIPNGSELPAAPAAVANKSGTLILSIGRLERYKGHHRAIQGVHKLQWRIPDVRLTILGSGPYENELRKLVKTLRLGEKVSFQSIPPADRQMMASALSAADLVVLLSEYEAHPVAVMEALAMGRRVLTTDTSGFAELTRKGLTRTVALDSSPIEIAAAMEEALKTPSCSAKIILPTWDDCANKLSEVYQAAACRRA
jgi:glycosyltransferase involved in cell wall biosynthesis